MIWGEERPKASMAWEPSLIFAFSLPSRVSCWLNVLLLRTILF
ncbi:hypothetical protein AtDm6_1469 [Acetobacter tropicalis]|uniref:Uncharacterized protein n=1 Tax=Acetobacter tropicalis TaxID=104102 RepID=A0A095B512_9PROT|nr:hypothetical protein AtDm6_1469 [Acetobacter tropicalis]